MSALHDTFQEDNAQNKFIIINIAQQTLSLYSSSEANVVRAQAQGFDTAALKDSHLIRTFEVSTAKNGIGNLEGTGCTPLGAHIIAQKIGGEAVEGSVFVGRVPTGEVYSQQLAAANPDRDWILTRILWLKGCEPGVNLGSNEQGCCDTYQRYIYIHGTPDTEPMGVPFSHGCVRMRNKDIIWLYEQLEEGVPVHIVDK